MPHVIVKLQSGRSDQQKMKIAAEVTKAIVATANCGEDAVSVCIEDVASNDWTEKVYKPDIIGNSGQLYKNPVTSLDRNENWARQQAARLIGILSKRS
jgi:4-oxalocrotonate tautomerase